METFGNSLKFVLPIFLFLILLEMIVSKFRNRGLINSMDAVSSLSSGLTNILFRTLGVTIYVISYERLVKHCTIYPVQWGVLQYAIGFIAIDFYAYWWHRFRHEYNVLWNEHLIHHSSEEYNLPVALRQTLSDIVNPATILLLPAAIFGVPTEVIVVLGVVMLFGGFWYHTQLIDKMGFLEHIIVTPSHHRIHHAINPIYIDKNYGGILIIWDKLFGTFQPELPNEKPVYGLTRPANTYNPIKINFQHLVLLAKDARRTAILWDKLRIWFMPTGWRPSDVAEKFPILSIKDPGHQVKYNTNASFFLHVWAWTQLIVTFLILQFLISQIAKLPKVDIILYSGFIFLSVYSYTSLMDKSRFAWLIELLRLTTGLLIIKFYNDWFTLDSFLPHGTALLIAYLTISTVISIAFEYFDFKAAADIQKDGV